MLLRDLIQKFENQNSFAETIEGLRLAFNLVILDSDTTAVSFFVHQDNKFVLKSQLENTSIVKMVEIVNLEMFEDVVAEVYYLEDFFAAIIYLPKRRYEQHWKADIAFFSYDSSYTLEELVQRIGRYY